MNAEAILALIGDLYAQLHAANQRALTAEQRLAEQQPGDGQPERGDQQ